MSRTKNKIMVGGEIQLADSSYDMICTLEVLLEYKYSDILILRMYVAFAAEILAGRRRTHSRRHGQKLRRTSVTMMFQPIMEQVASAAHSSVPAS